MKDILLNEPGRCPVEFPRGGCLNFIEGAFLMGTQTKGISVS